MRSIFLLFSLVHLTSFAQERQTRLEFSFGAGKTQLVEMRSKYPNGRGNEDYTKSSSVVLNKYDLTLGVNCRILEKRAFRFESGIYLSGASSSTSISLYYHGIDRDDSYLTESMLYHFYCLEIPVRIGFRFNKRYPISLTLGVVPAIGLINASTWNYVATNSESWMDANGNWTVTTTTTNHSEPFQSPGVIIGTCTELKIPLFPLKQNWASISFGANNYLTPLTRFEHQGSFGTNNILRLSHKLFYLRVNIPFSFSFENETPEEGGTIPGEY